MFSLFGNCIFFARSLLRKPTILGNTPFSSIWHSLQNDKKSVFYHVNYIFIMHCLKIITASKIVSKESRY